MEGRGSKGVSGELKRVAYIECLMGDLMDPLPEYPYIVRDSQSVVLLRTGSLRRAYQIGKDMGYQMELISRNPFRLGM